MSASRRRVRVVVDSNVIVSGMTHKLGLPRRLLRAWYARAYDLLIAEDQLAERRDVFTRPRIVQRYALTDEELAELFQNLAAATPVMPSLTIPVPVRDVKDEHILAAAIGGTIDYLVTSDKDLLVLRDDPRLGDLRIVTVAEFLTILQG